MKAELEAMHSPGSFLVREFREMGFSAPYHFHPELELTYIVEGTGIRYVGNSRSDYTAGDFVLLGPNLPHCWKSNTSPVKSHSIVVHFQLNFLGPEFFSKPEMRQLQLMLRRAAGGLHFTAGSGYGEKMRALLLEKEGFKKVLLFLDLLHELSQTRKYVQIGRQHITADISLNERQRITDVIAYIVDNFQERISLEQAAKIANLTKPAFCKYFKRITRKTFVEMVTDYRIDYAMQQLVLSEDSVAVIAARSGFEDVSNFHRAFKSRMTQTPLQYRANLLDDRADKSR